MKIFNITLLLSVLLLLFSCSKDADELSGGISNTADESFSPAIVGGEPAGSSGQGGNTSGLITAGEWDDLDNWDFWLDSLINGEYAAQTEMWGFYPKNRVAVTVQYNLSPVIDAQIELYHNGSVIWQARTDNHGEAELWVNAFESGNPINVNDLSIHVNGFPDAGFVVLYENGVNNIQLDFPPIGSTSKVDLAFIVDATGSMGDEIEFLKSDLKDVIQRVENNNFNLNISTGTVFYRDEGDEYLVKHSPFTNDIDSTSDFIGEQSAGGGGDFPEAVHSGLSEAINTLEWSAEARTRIAFILLDAPPHNEQRVLAELRTLVQAAAQKGIKIVPITASGIDKNTEFLMRFFSTLTNGTYVFITNDSGIGNDHISATVGDYEVEFLNDLMVRLVTEYSE